MNKLMKKIQNWWFLWVYYKNRECQYKITMNNMKRLSIKCVINNSNLRADGIYYNFILISWKKEVHLHQRKEISSVSFSLLPHIEAKDWM